MDQSATGQPFTLCSLDERKIFITPHFTASAGAYLTEQYKLFLAVLMFGNFIAFVMYLNSGQVPADDCSFRRRLVEQVLLDPFVMGRSAAAAEVSEEEVENMVKGSFFATGKRLQSIICHHSGTHLFIYIFF